jgi:hypothetical protein
VLFIAHRARQCPSSAHFRDLTTSCQRPLAQLHSVAAATTSIKFKLAQLHISLSAAAQAWAYLQSPYLFLYSPSTIAGPFDLALLQPTFGRNYEAHPNATSQGCHNFSRTAIPPWLSNSPPIHSDLGKTSLQLLCSQRGQNLAPSVNSTLSPNVQLLFPPLNHRPCNRANKGAALFDNPFINLR